MNKSATLFQAALLAFVFSMITALTMFAINRSANGSDKTKEELKLKADKTYVDTQDNKLDERINTKADKDVIKIMQDDLKDIKENTRMIINNQLKNK